MQWAWVSTGYPSHPPHPRTLTPVAATPNLIPSKELTGAGSSPPGTGAAVPCPGPHRHGIAGAGHEAPQRQASVLWTHIHTAAL